MESTVLEQDYRKLDTESSKQEAEVILTNISPPTQPIHRWKKRQSQKVQCHQIINPFCFLNTLNFVFREHSEKISRKFSISPNVHKVVDDTIKLL